MKRAVLAALMAVTAALILGPGSAVGEPEPRAVAAPPIPVEPFSDYAGTLSFRVTEITPALVTSAGPATVTLAGEMTNTGDAEITGLIGRIQRGDRLADLDEVRSELTGPRQPETIKPEEFDEIPGPLAAGASMPFRVSAPLVGADQASLRITEPGVYPIC